MGVAQFKLGPVELFQQVFVKVVYVKRVHTTPDDMQPIFGTHVFDDTFALMMVAIDDIGSNALFAVWIRTTINQPLIKHFQTRGSVCEMDTTNDDRVEEMSLEELLLFETRFDAYDKNVQKELRHPTPDMYIYYEQRLPHFATDAVLTRISARKRDLFIQQDPRAKRFYENVVHMDHTEIVNGYTLYGFHGTSSYLSYTLYARLSRKVTKHENMSDEAFGKWLDDNLCTDWNKQSTTGKYYGGPYWKADEGTEEYENAYRLTGLMNRRALMALPFHRSLIKESIRLGCNSRMESVKYTNSFCVWFERTRNVVEI